MLIKHYCVDGTVPLGLALESIAAAGITEHDVSRSESLATITIPAHELDGKKELVKMISGEEIHPKAEVLEVSFSLSPEPYKDPVTPMYLSKGATSDPELFLAAAQANNEGELELFYWLESLSPLVDAFYSKIEEPINYVFPYDVVEPAAALAVKHVAETGELMDDAAFEAVMLALHKERVST